ncbi:MAG: PAS domain-containing protein [Anaerolineae bacterium]|nr:PAS domain-containing protein [Anaerolineae bacterium]
MQPSESRNRSWWDIGKTIIVPTLILLGLWVSGRHSHLLFHTLAESFHVAITCTLFIIVWNSWDYLENGFFRFLGIAFLFVGGFNLTHAMAYEGMPFFQKAGANLATQFWMAGRFLEVLAFFIAAHLVGRRTPRYLTLILSLVAFLAFLLAIIGGIFPPCTDATGNPTLFTTAGRLGIAAGFLIVIFLLHRRRAAFSADVFRWLVLGLALKTLSELTLVSLSAPHSRASLAGLLVEIIGVFFLYKAVAETGLRQPYTLLFRSLQQRNQQLEQEVAERRKTETSLAESEERYRAFIDQAVEGVFRLEVEPPMPIGLSPAEAGQHLFWNTRLAECNPAFMRMFRATDAPIPVTRLQRRFKRHAAREITPDAIRRFTQAGFRIAREPSTSASDDGLERHFINNATGVIENGHLVRIWCTRIEVTAHKRAEIALQDSLRQLQLLVENSPVGIFNFDEQLRITECNDRFVAILRSRRNLLVGLDMHRLRDRRVLPAMEKVLAGLEGLYVGPYETTTSRARIWVTLRTAPIRDARGKVIGGVGIVEDVTDRREAEVALWESEERLRTLINAMPDIVCFKDGEGRWLEANDFTRQLFQLTGEDYRGKTNAELGKLNPFFQRAFAGDEATDALVWDAQAISRGDQTIPRPDGSPRAFDVIKVPMFSENGKRKGLVVVGRDVTARKRVEEERERLLEQIHLQATRMRQIVEAVPEGIILLDADRTLLLANPAGVKALNALAPDRGYAPLTRLGDRSVEALLGPEPKGRPLELKAPPRIFEAAARLVALGAGGSGWVLVLRDVTEVRLIQARVQQQERLAVVGQLAAGIAHDFNNIMAVIALYADMLSRIPALPENAYERVKTVQDLAHQAAHVTEQLLDFSRRTVFERKSVALLPLVQEQLHLLKRALPHNINIDIQWEPGSYLIHGDPTGIQQVLVNLVVNARDAMPDGGTINVTLNHLYFDRPDAAPLPDMPPGAWIHLALQDTGTGIAPDVLPHIFEPFFTTKAPGQGSGLGLSQVHGIVGSHEGAVHVESEPSNGTTFHIYLPAVQAPDTLQDDMASPDIPRGRAERILVVEDNEHTRQALADSLAFLDYQVETAPGAGEALDFLTEHGAEIALILSDLIMPEMDGAELLKELRRRGHTLPVILLTGQPNPELFAQLIASEGLTAWLAKPVSLEDLAQVLDEALG